MHSDEQTKHALQSLPPQVSVVFMGTPEFAVPTLEMLIQEGYHLTGVVTQPDRPTGREQAVTPPPIKELALQHNLPLLQPEKLNDETFQILRSWKPDLIVVAAYGKILPEPILHLPGFGCVNVHASLLPRWRGASPVPNALIAGDKTTGVSLMLLDQGMDTGSLLATELTPIAPDERADELLTRLSIMGADLLRKTIPQWIKRSIEAKPQNEEGATLCQLIEREDGRIFWSAPAEEIYNRYRGLSPWPGIFTFWQRSSDDIRRLKLIEIRCQKTPPSMTQPSGTVIEVGESIGIMTGSGIIFPTVVQLEGKSAQSIDDFTRGYPEFLGALLT